MNNDQVNQIVNSIGAMCELWGIVHENFVSQGMNEADALAHTKALMSIMLGNMMGSNNTEV